MSGISFAQIREDARVEQAVVETSGAQRILTIASGGCTALSLLRDEVEQVIAVDMNPAQVALVALRAAAIARLDRDAYLRFIGSKPCDARQETYARLKDTLLPEHRAYWDAHAALIAEGVQHVGATERFYRFLGDNLRYAVLDEAHWDELFAAKTLEAQVTFYQTHCANASWDTALRILLSRTSHLAFFPAYMFAHVTEHHYGDFFAERFRHEVHTRLMRDNYFLSQIVKGDYLWDVPGGMPYVLDPVGYDEVRRNIDKLKVVEASVAALPPWVEGVDALFLSNIFDWATPDEGEVIGCALLERIGPSAVAVVRNMLADVRLPASLAERWESIEGGDTIASYERSMLYRTVRAGRLK